MYVTLTELCLPPTFYWKCVQLSNTTIVNLLNYGYKKIAIQTILVSHFNNKVNSNITLNCRSSVKNNKVGQCSNSEVTRAEHTTIGELRTMHPVELNV